MRAIGYTRLSKATANGGVGLDVQREAIEAACKQRRWKLADVHKDRGHGGASMSRPAVQKALGELDAGNADVLVVSRLDRLSRSVVDFGQLIERSRRNGWGLVVLDMDVDTTTPTGELIANVMVSVVQFERRMIGQRTKEALAVKRARGIRIGRPRQLSKPLVKRIDGLREKGWTTTAIAAKLNADRVPTAHGGKKWWPETVRQVLNRAYR